jgi:hypothetical protein
MASEDQFLNIAHRGAGSRLGSRQLLPLTVNGNGTVSGIMTLPAGCWLHSVAIETPSAISGTPTSALVRVGISLAGQEIVADVDAKAQGHIAATIVAGFDAVAGLGNVTSLFLQAVTSGGTAPAGTINILVGYDAPVL